MLLEKRVAVITGAASGMGKTVAPKFVSAACDVVVSSSYFPSSLYPEIVG